MPTFPKYESYKNSGVAWLEDIPEHWEVLPGRAYLKPKKVKNTGNKVDTVLSLSYGKIVIKPEEKLHGLVPESFETYQIVEPGDIIVRATDLQNDHTSLRIGLVGDRGIITSAYLCLHPTEMMNSRFAYYLLHSYDLLKVYYGMGSGLRQNLDYTDFKYLPLTVPSLEEQKRIVEFLDRTTTEIDRAISQKQRLIELLQEQKAILINQAVTKGLTPNVPMRDSGIEWLGEIPEHWNFRRAKFLFRQSRLSVRKTDDVVTCYRDGEVTLRTNRRADGYTVAILEQGYQGVRSGQLVINSMDAFAGAIGVSDSDGKCSPEYVVCDPVNPDSVEPKYYALLLREMALKGYIEVICPAVRQRGLRIRYNGFAQLLLPLPSKEEQEAITTQVDAIVSGTAETLDSLDREIDLLKEMKSIVISQAVTGKIKV
ncbi:MAG: restriction endonuclease subunit S [Cyanobacteria bacterium P01_C01_bin.120]